MPTYTILDNETQKEFEIVCSNTDKEALLAENPHWQQLLTKAPLIGDAFRLTASSRKPDEGFRDHLREMKKKHLHNTINVR